MLATLRGLRAETPSQVEILLLPDGPDAATIAALDELKDFPQSATTEARGAPACFNRLVTSSDANVLVLLESGARVGPGWLSHLLAALDEDERNGLAGPTTNLSWNEQGVYPHAGSATEEIARTARETVARFGDETRTLEPLYSLADFCYAVRREVIEAIGGADESYGLGPCWEMDYNVRAARAGFRGVWACAAYVHRAPYTARRRYEEARRFEASKRLYQDNFCGARLRGEKQDFRAHCRGDACPNFAPPDLIEVNRPLPAAAHVAATVAATRPITIPALDQLFKTPTQAAKIERESVQSKVEARAVGNDDEQIVQPLLPPLLLAQVDEPQFPLVSCIMPTFNRRSFVPLAVRNFLRQDYPNLELIILDDGTENAFACIPKDARVRYIRLDRKLNIGAKRNAACELARGPIIVHWDDDDWYPRRRVSAQVRALLDNGADVAGTSRLLYFDASLERAWEYRYAAAGAPWVAGNTLAYRRDFWERNKFPDVQIGEDSLFLWNEAAKSVHDLDDPHLCVATVHAGNTSRKKTDGMFWHTRPVADVHELLGDELHLYRANFLPTDLRAWPLVSCIMPTFNRRSFVPLAVENFLAQDYPCKELIVVDDGDDAVADLCEGISGVKYERLQRRVSIGAKRNIACSLSEGEVIAHWDDDDWYSPERLRYQVRPLLACEAEMTGLENAFVLELPGGAFWTTQPHLHRRMFVGDVHGGTLVYRRELLSLGLRYPEINLAEDAWLLHYAVSRGQRLLRLPNPGLFVYVRHGSNAWGEFAPGSFLDPSGWQRIAPPHTFAAEQLARFQKAAADVSALSSIAACK